MKTKRTCEVENCSREVFGKKRCRVHYPKTPIKKVTERGLAKKQEKKERTEKLISFYLDLWDSRADKNGNINCFESDTLLSHTVYKNNLCCYSHYLPKALYPQYAFEDWNVEIVHPDEHSQWESDPTKCEKMYKKYKKLKEQYG